MKERPILFSVPMVRAILEGRKAVTRRIIKPQPKERVTEWGAPIGEGPYTVLIDGREAHCPYGQPGDRLWVRETWGVMRDKYHRLCYLTDLQCPHGRSRNQLEGGGWKPSIFMPRSASRILLEVVSVRTERLQDITEEEAVAEGIDMDSDYANLCANIESTPYPNDLERGSAAITVFKELWESINDPGSWNDNPWVWVVNFRRIAK